MLDKTRQAIIHSLWQDYCKITPHVKHIALHLSKKNITMPPIDHLAIIDLPGPHTGIRELQNIFSHIGYTVQGADYLPDKQNDFAWLAANNTKGLPATAALPQVVVADFRLDELPREIRDIIFHYSSQAPASPLPTIATLARQMQEANLTAAQQLQQIFRHYLSGRDWPLPSLREFNTVNEFNELLAWVLVFGRRPNHFTYSIHLLPEFNSLQAFHEFICNETGLALNQDGGEIKGSRAVGIEQGSTAGTPETIALQDGTVQLPNGFVEFVWRYHQKDDPYFWEDYFTGFVATHANRVIQSLYATATV